jgi:hypothetical protein
MPNLSFSRSPRPACGRYGVVGLVRELGGVPNALPPEAPANDNDPHERERLWRLGLLLGLLAWLMYLVSA